MDFEGLSRRNKEAWDQLYGSTRLPVWGRDPMPFVAEAFQRLAIRLEPGSRVLDAGSGEGRNFEVLLGSGADVHGCDASRSAMRKIPAALRSRVRLLVCDLGSLPYRDGAFDLAFAVDVVETLPDPASALAEIRRTLRPGGLFLCNIPGEEDGVFGRDMTPAEGDGYLFRGSFFYRFLSEGDAADMLEGCGFRILDVGLRTWSEPPHPNFRAQEHVHTSRVFLAERTG